MDEIRLRIPDEHGQPREVAITSQGAILGRCPQHSDIVIPWVLVSRKHCRIFQVNGKWYVEDLGSRHGTYVNGKRVTRSQIRFGDQLFFSAPPATMSAPVADRSLTARAKALLRMSDTEPDNLIGVICKCGYQFKVQREMLHNKLICPKCKAEITAYADSQNMNSQKGTAIDPDKTDFYVPVNPLMEKHPILSQLVISALIIGIALYIGWKIHGFVSTSHRHSRILAEIAQAREEEKSGSKIDSMSHYRAALEMATSDDENDREVGPELRDAKNRLERLHKSDAPH